MIRDIVWPLVALACLAIGYVCGKWAGLDKAADEQVEAQFAAMPKRGRHVRAEPRRLPAAPKAVSPSTESLFRQLEADRDVMALRSPSDRPPWVLQAAEVPVMAPARRQLGNVGHPVPPLEQQPPLRELLQRPDPGYWDRPRTGPTTDAIRAMQEDTDRWLAARGML